MHYVVPARLVDLGPQSRTDELRDRLKQLKAPIWGTKHELWTRVVKEETRAELRLQERRWVEGRAKQLSDAAEGSTIIQELRQPKEAPLSKEEVEKHALTHLPPRPDWCRTCALARTRKRDHTQKPEPELEPPRM